MKKQSFDYVIIGAGIMGLAMAEQIIINKPDASLCIIDHNEITLNNATRASGAMMIPTNIFEFEGKLGRINNEARSYWKEYERDFRERTGYVSSYKEFPVVKFFADKVKQELFIECLAENNYDTRLTNNYKEVEPLLKDGLGEALIINSIGTIDQSVFLRNMHRWISGRDNVTYIDGFVKKINDYELTMSDYSIEGNKIIAATGAFTLNEDMDVLPSLGISIRAKINMPMSSIVSSPSGSISPKGSGTNLYVGTISRSFEWSDWDNHKPNKKDYERIETNFHNYVNKKLVVVDCRYGIRAISKRGTPIVKNDNHILSINGLGRNGMLQAPLLSRKVFNDFLKD